MASDAAPIHDRKALDELAGRFRYIITDMICRAGSGHLGGALSLVEIIITLYYRIMKLDPEESPLGGARQARSLQGTRGSGALHGAGIPGLFPERVAATLNRNGTRLPSHVDQNQTPGVDMTAGSLGQGLSCACGIALAGQDGRQDHNVFCIIGDGESNEGQIWEAALFAGHNRLDNLVAICDYNKLQIDGRTDDVLTLEPLADKWRAFGWEVFEMDGHDWDRYKRQHGEGHRGQGETGDDHRPYRQGRRCHCQYEGQVGSHNIKVPDEATYRKIIEGIDA